MQDLVTLYPPDYASFRLAVESHGSLDAKERVAEPVCMSVPHLSKAWAACSRGLLRESLDRD